MVRGACLCGAVTYEVQQPFGSLVHCHCSMCRKHHGAPFSSWVDAPLDRFRFTSGTEHILTYQSSCFGRRSSCRICGSVTPTLLEGANLALCPAGNLEGDLGVKPSLHMFAASKAPWYEITDDLPRHDGYPPEYGAQGVERPPVAQRPAGVAHGTCLCGEVAFEYEGKPLRMFMCHCSRCRRARSAAHGANAFVGIGQFRWIRGEDRVVSYKLPEAVRFGSAFCRICGGAAPRVVPESDFALVPVAMLDSDPGMRPLGHIFTAYKASWFDITGPIPQFAELPPPS